MGLHLGGLLEVATVCGPAGSLLPIPGAILLDDCQPCLAGWFCFWAGLSTLEAVCEGGWFCPRASVSGHSPHRGALLWDYQWVGLEGNIPLVTCTVCGKDRNTKC